MHTLLLCGSLYIQVKLEMPINLSSRKIQHRKSHCGTKTFPVLYLEKRTQDRYIKIAKGKLDRRGTLQISHIKSSTGMWWGRVNRSDKIQLGLRCHEYGLNLRFYI